MTTEAQKTELLEDFQEYLRQDEVGIFEVDKQPDLSTLLGELSSLKTEVKAESRQFKNTLDTLSSTLDMVKDNNKVLSTELARSAEQQAQQQDEMMRTMLLEMVDIYDRLSTGVGGLQNYQPVTTLFKHSRKKDVRIIERFTEGQQMTIRRFEQILQGHQVRAIECVGKMLDPVTMSAVETGEDEKHINGIVLEELRKGFLYKEQVLRLAEVKVNKTKAG